MTPQTPAERLVIVRAELARLDALLATLWHVDTRAEVGHRRAQVLHLAHLIAAEAGEAFTWPHGPPHPQRPDLTP